jgi:2'-5' RNA ligase
MDGRGLHVLYFALRPSPEAARAALDLAARACARHGLRARPTPAARLHVTLNGLGAFDRVPPQVAARARRAAGQVAARPFNLMFNRFAAWGRGAGRRPVVLYGDEGVIGAEALHDQIHARLAEAGLVRRPLRPISPHMTLLRETGEVAPAFVPPITWRVTEFVLVDVLHGQGRREILGAWPLNG